MMVKLKAFLIHFLLSALVILGFAGLIWFVWYPEPFLMAEGGLDIILLLIGVDLILGPTLTAIVYKKGKKGLYFDLTLIVLVQLSALLYGMHTLYIERPQYVAFVVDRFTTIPAASIDTDELLDKNLLTRVFNKPRLVFIELEEDPDTRFHLLMESVYGGKGYPGRPEYYRDIGGYINAIVNNERQLKLVDILRKSPEIEKMVLKMAETNNKKLDQLVFYPLKGKRKQMILILDREDLSVLGGLDLDPWPAQQALER